MPDQPLERFRALPADEQAELRERVQVLVITGLGLNCEAETEAAFRLAGASPRRVHLLDLLDRPETRLGEDRDRRASSVASRSAITWARASVFANKIRFRLYDPLVEFIDRGGLAIGICNGFQTMVRLGMLPGLDGDYRTPRATLAPNDRLGYRDAWVRLGFDAASPCVWTRGLTTMELPSRHGEGKFLAESPQVLERIEAHGQVAARYIDPDGRPTEEWPHNPNGSPHGVAGVCDPSGRLFGLMPHPDAYLYGFHHPNWIALARAGKLPADGEGLAIFRNGVDAAAISVAFG